MTRLRTYRYKNKQLSIAQLLEFSVVPKQVLRNRLGDGWDIEEALATPKKVRAITRN